MEGKIRILLIDGDSELRKDVVSFLHDKGFDVEAAVSSRDSIEFLYKEDFDFVILEPNLSDRNGYDTAMLIKKISPQIGLIFISTENTNDDKLRAFSVGADDFIVKPFSNEELVMRILAITRRMNKDKRKKDIFKYDNFTFDSKHQLISYEYPDGHEEQLKLTSKENEVLKIFCQHPNEIVDRSTILHRVWKGDTYFNARSMDVYITKLRKYLRKFPNIDIINQHGVGFKLIFRDKE